MSHDSAQRGADWRVGVRSRRYLDLAHLTQRVSWRWLDTLTIKLGYFDQREDHTLVLVNGKPSGKSYTDLGGAISAGEFALMQSQIFDPASQAVFTWKKWNKACPISLSTTAVTYDFADVGGEQYLLPASSETEMWSRELWTRNRAEYRDYRQVLSRFHRPVWRRQVIEGCDWQTTENDGLPYRCIRAEPPLAKARTCSNVAMEVSPGNVVNSAP